MSVIAFAAPSRSWTPSLPHRAGVVETDQPLPVRRVQDKRATQPLWTLRRDFGSHRDERHSVSRLVHEQRLTLMVEQGVEPQVSNDITLFTSIRSTHFVCLTNVRSFH